MDRHIDAACGPTPELLSKCGYVTERYSAPLSELAAALDLDVLALSKACQT